MGMDYLPRVQRTPPQPWTVGGTPDMSPLDPAEVQLRQVLHAAGQRQGLMDAQDFVDTVMNDPDLRRQLVLDAAGAPVNADRLAADLADRSPHLVAGMNTRLRRAAHLEDVPQLQLRADDTAPGPVFTGSPDGGAGGRDARDSRTHEPDDMNALIRRGPRARGQ